MFVTVKIGLAVKSPNCRSARELRKILSRTSVFKYQAASLTRAAYRDESEVPNIKPFPYQTKEYNIINMMLDTSQNRVHKHAKIIVIDGPIASGKAELAKKLAKEFDFLYLPQKTMNDVLITPWGFDRRTLDSKLPESCRTWDVERFLMDPTNKQTLMLQLNLYNLRQTLYIDALAHILCTGQGVVTVRSPWVDTVFAKTLYQNNYISKTAFDFHTDCCLASNYYYLRPHLIIYLDVPPEITQQKIKKRGLPHEVNSKVLSTKYLEDLEENYKADYLSKLAPYSNLLIYDWRQGGDTEAVTEDIENLEFEDFEEHDTKMTDWKFAPGEWKVHAKNFAFEPEMFLRNMDLFRTDIPELLITGDEIKEYDEVCDEVPDLKYQYGYNPLKGDVGLFGKYDPVPINDYVTPLMEKYLARKRRESQK